MAVRVGINGFGRIGRLVLRAAMEEGRNDIEFVAVNDLGDVKTNAHLLKYDSVHGTFPGEITSDDKSITVNGHKVEVLAQRDPTKLPWKDLGVDIVFECTGIFSDRDKAVVHLEAGAPKVLVSAPSKGADATIVYGVNHNDADQARRRSSPTRRARPTAWRRRSTSSTRRSASSAAT